jgi:cephalosporin hydroxylase
MVGGDRRHGATVNDCRPAGSSSSIGVMRAVADSLRAHVTAVEKRRPRFADLYGLIDSNQDLPLETWAPLFALAVDLRPDVILELGRGRGNSTCVFVEAAHEIGACVVSVGFDGGDGWDSYTSPRIAPAVGDSWFEPLITLDQDILETDFKPFLIGARRVLVFWDAHGVGLAEALLVRLVPLLPGGSEVVVHDIADAEEIPAGWEFRVGPFGSMFGELVVVWEYIEQNGLPYASDLCLRFALPD